MTPQVLNKISTSLHRPPTRKRIFLTELHELQTHQVTPIFISIKTSLQNTYLIQVTNFPPLERQEAHKVANAPNIPDPTDLEATRRLSSVKMELEIALGNITMELGEIQVKSTDKNLLKYLTLVKSQVEKINEIKSQIKAHTAVLLEAIIAGPLPAGEEEILRENLTAAAN